MPAISLSNGGSDWEQKKLASKPWGESAGHKVFSNRQSRTSGFGNIRHNFSCHRSWQQTAIIQ
jgi:hypothetical protein